VAESAVVGYPHDLFGEGIYAFVILKSNTVEQSEADLINELKAAVKNRIVHYAIPHRFLVRFSILTIKWQKMKSFYISLDIFRI
jgi:acetyl-CoA synthetase